jgi:RimJ/RimL family protein N-acetyltransferase
MLCAIDLPLAQRIRPLVSGQHLTLMTEAMIAGNSPARIWVDDPDAPRSAYIWDRGHCHYLAGAAANAQFNDAVHRLIIETVAPAILAQGSGFFKVYSTSSDWDAALAGIHGPWPLKQRARVFYGLDQAHVSDWRSRLAAGFQVQRIERTLLTQRSLQNVQWLVEEIESCWPSLDLFLEKAFGFYACSPDAVAGWCTGEYVSARKIGIGIATIETFQQRGLATAMASAFVEHATAQGLTAHWDAFAENLPSVRVAEKVGFTKLADYAVHVGMFSL